MPEVKVHDEINVELLLWNNYAEDSLYQPEIVLKITRFLYIQYNDKVRILKTDTKPKTSTTHHFSAASECMEVVQGVSFWFGIGFLV